MNPPTSSAFDIVILGLIVSFVFMVFASSWFITWQNFYINNGLSKMNRTQRLKYYLSRLYNFGSWLFTGYYYDDVSDGRMYLKGNRLHRIGGPAWIGKNGVYKWFERGKLHRIGGPAVQYPSGNEEWLENGLHHRNAGPAIVGRDRLEWWVDGKKHRFDGPAIEWASGRQDWFLNGLRHNNLGPAIVHTNGDQEWWVAGELHREDGPAIVHTSGELIWYRRGKVHRDGDSPAHIKLNGDRIWYKYGRIHRDINPAIESADGKKAWYYLGTLDSIEDSPTHRVWYNSVGMAIKELVDGVVKNIDRSVGRGGRIQYGAYTYTPAANCERYKSPQEQAWEKLGDLVKIAKTAKSTANVEAHE